MTMIYDNINNNWEKKFLQKNIPRTWQWLQSLKNILLPEENILILKDIKNTLKKFDGFKQKRN